MDDLSRLLSIKRYVDRLVEDALAERTSQPAADEVQASLMEGDFIDTAQAAERYSVPRDTIARWCAKYGIGRKVGGRWQVSIQATNRHLGLR